MNRWNTKLQVFITIIVEGYHLRCKIPNKVHYALHLNQSNGLTKPYFESSGKWKNDLVVPHAPKGLRTESFIEIFCFSHGKNSWNDKNE